MGVQPIRPIWLGGSFMTPAPPPATQSYSRPAFLPEDPPAWNSAETPQDFPSWMLPPFSPAITEFRNPVMPSALAWGLDLSLSKIWILFLVLMGPVAVLLLQASLALWANLCMTSGDLGICILPPDGGLCYTLQERWYFDYEKKACLPFSWTGCGGNENNFKSWPECQKACSRYA